jgi:hypothetical protein
VSFVTVYVPENGQYPSLSFHGCEAPFRRELRHIEPDGTAWSFVYRPWGVDPEGRWQECAGGCGS